MAMADRLQILVNTARAANAEPKRATTSVSRGIQTDAATISLWDLLPKYRSEAYERGFTAGTKHGHDEGITEGVSIGMTEGLVTGLEQGKKEEFERGIDLGREMGYDAGLAEGLRRATVESEKQRDIIVTVDKERTAMMREKIIVRLPSTTPNTATKDETGKENTKPKATPEPTPEPTPMPFTTSKPTPATKIAKVDPFEWLVGLLRMK